MSLKTLRSSNHSAIVLTAQRPALQRLHVACAVGLLALAPVTAFALELGEAALRSGLGQSLRVDIPYRLSADERLTPGCIGLMPALRPDRGLPTYSRASRIDVTPTHIQIFGANRVLEPLIGLTVDVHCASTPHFVRSYELFVDPPAAMPTTLADGTQVASARAGAASDAPNAFADSRPAAAPDVANRAATSRSTASAATTATPRADVSARARGQTGGLLAQGEAYLVVRGDTLSGIAARIADRRETIRDAAEAIFAANPQVFTRGNRDLIEAGRSITIPILAPATAAMPALPEIAAIPTVRAAEQAAASPSAPLPQATASEIQPLRGEAAASAVTEAIEPPAPAVAGVQPSAAPISVADSATAEAASSATAASNSTWLTALLALGVVIALATPLLLVRRRKHEKTRQSGAKLRPSPPRQLVDPVAGFDVVEGDLPRTPSQSPGLPLDIAATGSVDLDVGAPITGDARVDWFADPAGPTAPAGAAAADPTIEEAAPVQLVGAVTVPEQPPERAVDVADPTIEDEQHTLTIVELDMLREDYEAEYTLTQEASKALRDAVADLKATQAARAANADTATLEMPQQPQTETIETQQTQKLRSSR